LAGEISQLLFQLFKLD